MNIQVYIMFYKRGSSLQYIILFLESVIFLFFSAGMGLFRLWRGHEVNKVYGIKNIYYLICKSGVEQRISA